MNRDAGICVYKAVGCEANLKSELDHSTIPLAGL